jgi:hypothetical protein
MAMIPVLVEAVKDLTAQVDQPTQQLEAKQ